MACMYIQGSQMGVGCRGGGLLHIYTKKNIKSPPSQKNLVSTKIEIRTHLENYLNQFLLYNMVIYCPSPMTWQSGNGPCSFWHILADSILMMRITGIDKDFPNAAMLMFNYLETFSHKPKTMECFVKCQLIVALSSCK